MSMTFDVLKWLVEQWFHLVNKERELMHGIAEHDANVFEEMSKAIDEICELYSNGELPHKQFAMLQEQAEILARQYGVGESEHYAYRLRKYKTNNPELYEIMMRLHKILKDAIEIVEGTDNYIMEFKGLPGGYAKGHPVEPLRELPKGFPALAELRGISGRLKVLAQELRRPE
jgi:hypothetical protein